MPKIIYGMDVSRHQKGRVDFAKAAEEGVKFCVIKASEGKDYVDPEFKNYWEQLVHLDVQNTAVPHKILRGVYHFARPDLRPNQGRSAGELEAKFFCGLMKSVGHYGDGCLPPALDWEKYGGGTTKNNQEWIHGFVDVVTSELGRPPMIYTGRNTWYYTTDDYDGLVHLALWQVAYQKTGNNEAGEPPRMPKKSSRSPWTPTMWQWSGGEPWDFYNQQSGAFPGVSGSGIVDVNRFMGTEIELYALAQVSATSPLPPPPPPIARVTQGIMPTLDLKDFDAEESLSIVEVVQGLLMANGQGPAGLIGSNGLPDGKCGDKTREAMVLFKKDHGLLPNTLVDAMAWWILLSP